MRNPFPEIVEKGRIRTGEFATDVGTTYGAFSLTCRATGERLKVIVGDSVAWELNEMDGEPWEHVSVSCARRCPTWVEMCFVKELFFRITSASCNTIQHERITSTIIRMYSICGVRP